jgi:esterase/lipase
MGHSMGGLVAAHLALRPAFDELSIRGIVILSARLTAPAGANTMSLRMKSSNSPKALMNYPNSTLSNPMTHDAESDAAYQADPLVYHGALRARFTAEVIAAMDDATKKAGQFDAPVLVMHGTDNNINKPDASRQWFAACGSADKTYFPVPGAFHELHNEAEPYGSLFREELVKWMQARSNVVRTDRGLAISARGLDVPPKPVYVPATAGAGSFPAPPMPPQAPMPAGAGMLNTFQMPGMMPVPPMVPSAQPQQLFGGFPGASPYPAMMPGQGVPV